MTSELSKETLEKTPVDQESNPAVQPAQPAQPAQPVEEFNIREVHASILREGKDPEDGYEPIPLWLVTAIMMVVFWAGMYLAYHSGGFRADVFDPSLLWAGAAQQEESGAPDPMVVGKRVFTQNCAVCHQATGQGVAGQFPPLVGSEWVLSQGWHGDNHLVKILLYGLEGVVEVKGNTYNNAMPAQKLEDGQIAAVLTYIRNEWGNSAPPITEEFVTEIREDTASRSGAWTQDELKAIPRILIESTEPIEEAAAAPEEVVVPEENGSEEKPLEPTS